MPELPEVETTRRDLEPLVTGRTITGVSVPDGQPGPMAPLSVAQFGDAVRGRTIERLERRGKYLIAALSGGVALVLHRRMTGNLLFARPEDAAPAFLRAVITLDDGAELRWQDQRRFGTWALADDPGKALSSLGPEPLAGSWTVADLAAALRGRTAPVKAVLLDQRRVAGLGNIYADESLHQAGIHPARPAGSLTPAETERVHTAIRAVLARAIHLQGSSARDYVGGLGQRGRMQEEWRVYERGGLPCYGCGGVIEKVRIAGRGTHLCPACQPALP